MFLLFNVATLMWPPVKHQSHVVFSRLDSYFVCLFLAFDLWNFNERAECNNFNNWTDTDQ